MATPKKPSRKKPAARKTSTSSRSSGGSRKSPAKRSAASRAAKTPAKRAAAKRASTSASKRKAPAKTARKTAPKSGSKAQAKAAAAAIPEIEVPGKTALAAKAEATEPSLRPGRRRSTGRWLAVAGLLAAVVVVIVLIASGGDDDNNNTVADTSPATTPVATTPTPTATSPAVTTPSAPAPAAKPVVRSSNCEPIIGSGTANGGKTYEVTSTARDGDPADCSEAHSVLLSALQGQGTTIGDWSCKTNLSGSPIASCTSTGGRSIQATG
jgi:1,4-alpha-glucan branching enzyme